MTDTIGQNVIDEMMQEVMDNNRAHGWHDDPRSFGDDIALLHSEVSEMFEAFRDNGGVGDATEHKNFCDGVPCICVNPPKPEGVGSEAADVLIRLLDTCGRYGLNLFEEYQRKMAYNKTRPHRHGGKAL